MDNDFLVGFARKFGTLRWCCWLAVEMSAVGEDDKFWDETRKEGGYLPHMIRRL